MNTIHTIRKTFAILAAIILMASGTLFLATNVFAAQMPAAVDLDDFRQENNAFVCMTKGCTGSTRVAITDPDTANEKAATIHVYENTLISGTITTDRGETLKKVSNPAMLNKGRYFYDAVSKTVTLWTKNGISSGLTFNSVKGDKLVAMGQRVGFGPDLAAESTDIVFIAEDPADYIGSSDGKGNFTPFNVNVVLDTDADGAYMDGTEFTVTLLPGTVMDAFLNGTVPLGHYQNVGTTNSDFTVVAPKNNTFLGVGVGPYVQLRFSALDSASTNDEFGAVVP